MHSAKRDLVCIAKVIVCFGMNTKLLVYGKNDVKNAFNFSFVK